MSGILNIIAACLAAASLAGCIYQIVAVREVRRFLDQPRPVPAGRPPVSVLKPLCGAEPDLAANLRSFCRQDYPRWQMISGVASMADAALPVVQGLADEYPKADLISVVDARVHGCNRKIGNLLNMLPAARHDLLVIADSDIRVTPAYLDDVVAALEAPSVGLVTCLYVGRAVGGLWSRLGAMEMNHGFVPSALVARAIGRRDGCFGATMALTRPMLERIGGLDTLKDVLADDWALGAAVRRTGLTIGLAARPVDVVVHESSLRNLLFHEIRWGRTIAAIDRPAYFASVLTRPLALAVLAVLAGRAGWPFLGVAAIATACRMWAVRAEERMLALPPANWAIVGLREALSFVVFIAAFCGRSVEWRGRRFRVHRDGTLRAWG